jgi:HEAT repeat protein
MDETDQILSLLELLESEKLDDRLTAIQILGEIGDAKALEALRQRMKLVNRELVSLVTAVGKLKKKLGVK